MGVEPTKIAVIGAGNMAQEHIKAFQALEQTDVVGITSRTRARAEELGQTYSIGAVTDNIEALWQRTKADLVVVAVSELATKTVVEACLQYPWHLLIEKPPGYQLREAQEIAAAAKTAERHVSVGMNRRHYSSTLAALTDLEADGSPRLIQIQDQQDMSMACQLGFPEDVVTHFMYANSIHLVDYLSIFGRGAATDVTTILPWTPEAPGTVAARIRFSSGDVGLYTAIWNGPAPWTCSISTSRRRWELRPLEKASFQNAGERLVTEVPQHVWDRDFKPGLRLQADLAVRTVRDGKKRLPDMADALKTMNLIHQIYNC